MSGHRRKTSILNARNRAEAGCIVSFESAAGQRLTLHVSNTRPTDGLSLALEEALAIDPSMRVVCYSTPETIATDLAGGRRAFATDFVKEGRPQIPELAMLTLVGRPDMLHPRLRRRETPRDRGVFDIFPDDDPLAAIRREYASD